MDVSNYLGSSDFLKAADLQGNQPTVEIKSVTEHTFQDGQTKLALEFFGKDKHVALNVTNTRALVAMFGAESDNWVGKKVMLSVRQTQMGPGLAVTPLGGQAAPAQTQPSPQAPSPQPVDGDFDDDIPF